MQLDKWEKIKCSVGIFAHNETGNIIPLLEAIENRNCGRPKSAKWLLFPVPAPMDKTNC